MPSQVFSVRAEDASFNLDAPITARTAANWCGRKEPLHLGQVRAGQAGNENLRLADDTLVDDAQRHAGVTTLRLVQCAGSW